MNSTSHGFRVLQPGVQTLLQDRGRFGWQHLGLTTGGAADEHAFLWANRLLGNPPNSAALEVCIGGLELEVQVPTRISITGADLRPRLNGEAVANWQTINVRPGDNLSFGYARDGVRAYLAVCGGFNVAPTFGSVATVTREGVGGLDGFGRSLCEHDWLPCSPAAPAPVAAVPSQFVPIYNLPLTLRVIENYRDGVFDETARATLYAEQYLLSSKSDRMGARLIGKPIAPQVSGIVSEGTPLGAVQIPADGQPIVLLKDRQTIGGYPKIGTVFALDAFALAQRQARSSVRFERISLQEAQRRLQQFYRFFDV